VSGDDHYVVHLALQLDNIDDDRADHDRYRHVTY
jgi:hypothetical protein